MFMLVREYHSGAISAQQIKEQKSGEIQTCGTEREPSNGQK